MPLSDQERRCVELACGYLGKEYGGRWRIREGQTLDEEHPSDPSPEVVITTGAMTAAVEVKRLTGDPEWQKYHECLQSLHRSLIPSCGGHYSLGPAVNFRLPVSPRFRKLLKREIERVAPGMAPGDSAPLRIPRKAIVKLIRQDGLNLVYCSHNWSGDMVSRFSSRISGAFWLIDDGRWEHSFLTDHAREEFFQTLAAA